MYARQTDECIRINCSIFFVSVCHDDAAARPNLFILLIQRDTFMSYTTINKCTHNWFTVVFHHTLMATKATFIQQKFIWSFSLNSVSFQTIKFYFTFNLTLILKYIHTTPHYTILYNIVFGSVPARSTTTYHFYATFLPLFYSTFLFCPAISCEPQRFIC